MSLLSETSPSPTSIRSGASCARSGAACKPMAASRSRTTELASRRMAVPPDGLRPAEQTRVAGASARGLSGEPREQAVEEAVAGGELRQLDIFVGAVRLVDRPRAADDGGNA